MERDSVDGPPQTPSIAEQLRKWGLGVLAWALGLLLAYGAVRALLKGDALSGICGLAMAVMLLPPIGALMAKRISVRHAYWLRAVVIFVAAVAVMAAPSTRRRALAKLAARQDTDAAALAAIVAKLEADDSEFVRADAALALGQGKASPKKVDALVGALDDKGRLVQRSAVRSLAALGKAELALPKLQQWLREESWVTRGAACEALAFAGDQAGPAISDLVKALGDSSAYVRERALATVLAVHPHPRELVEDLRAMQEDPDRDLRKAVARALRQHDPAYVTTAWDVGRVAFRVVLVVLGLVLACMACDALRGTAGPDRSSRLGDPPRKLSWPLRFQTLLCGQLAQVGWIFLIVAGLGLFGGLRQEGPTVAVFVLTAFLCGCGLLCLWVRFSDRRHALRLMRSGASAPGRMTGCSERRFGRFRRFTSYDYTFEFTAADGRVRTLGVTMPSARKGELEDEEEEIVLYDAGAPSDALVLDSVPGVVGVDRSGRLRVGSVPAILLRSVLPAAFVVALAWGAWEALAP